MKKERLLSAMGQIDDELIRDAMEVPARKKRKGWVRWVAVAACLCLLLASPVGAQMLGRLEEVLRDNGSASYYSPERILLRSVSDEAKAAAKSLVDNVGLYPMDSLAEAEEFHGLDLPENSVLNMAFLREFDVETADGTKYRAPCFVRLCAKDDGTLTAVDTELYYKVGYHHASVWYRVATEEMPFEHGAGIALDTDDARREEYVTPGGRECVLYVKFSGDECWGWYGQAFTVVDGYLVYVSLGVQSQVETMDAMKEILDGYD